MTRQSLDHIAVLAAETIALLEPSPGGHFIDCTVNGGGHSRQILDRTGPDGRLLALDADPAAVVAAREHLAAYGDRATVVHRNFREVAEVAAACAFPAAHGALMDLGFSSPQVESGGRGFAFSHNGPLDMRYDTTSGQSAADMIANLSETEIERLLRDYGEETQARRIAHAIVAERQREPICTTGGLAAVVAHAVGGFRRGKLHPATKTFQALRIAVNHELESLSEALPQVFMLLRSGGRLAVISFHSLEDRIVKNFMRHLAGLEQPPAPRALPLIPPARSPILRLVTRRPVSPSADELHQNPRSRSARLRVAERL